MATILVDFDGTCIPSLPMGGYTDYDTGADKVLIDLIKKGHKIVLWTVRNESINNPYNTVSKQFKGKTSLQEAVDWFKEKNISLFGVNEYPNEEESVGKSRKILGDILIDDVSIGIPMKEVKIKYYSCLTGKTDYILTSHVDWEKIRLMLKNLNLL